MLDPQARELGLEHGPPMAVLGGEDAAVVGEHGRGGAVPRPRCLEDLGDVERARDGEGDRCEREAAVVVDQVHDLDAAPVRELPVGHVGLPALIGQPGLEALEARARAFLRLRRHQAAAAQRAPDRRDRRRALERACQVPVDGERAGVETVAGQLLAQADDLVLDVRAFDSAKSSRIESRLYKSLAGLLDLDTGPSYANADFPSLQVVARVVAHVRQLATGALRLRRDIDDHFVVAAFCALRRASRPDVPAIRRRHAVVHASILLEQLALKSGKGPH